MKNIKYKKMFVPGMYAIAMLGLFFSIYAISTIISPNKMFYDDDYLFVSKNMFDNPITMNVNSTVETEDMIIKPYTLETVTVLNGFYDYTQSKENQLSSIIYYGDTYMQNSGINYTGEEKFDVLNIYNGTVASIKEDTLLGTTIEIKHSNDLISIYQCVSNVTVKEKDVIKTGQIIASSGNCDLINKDNSLHIETFSKGLVVNPESLYNKSVKEFSEIAKISETTKTDEETQTEKTGENTNTEEE